MQRRQQVSQHHSASRKGEIVGQLIMLGTLFGLITLIFGLVWYLDPEARGPRGGGAAADDVAAGDERR